MLSSANLVWLIPGLPLLGFLLHAFVGKRLPRGVVGGIATILVFASFILSVIVLLGLLQLPAEERRVITGMVPGGANVPWITIGKFEVYYRALVDPLSLLMCLIVTGVGGLIHLYSTGYMADDSDYPRFFTYLNLFIFFMLTLVLAENLLLMFVGWEGVGLCSYLLISFWYHDIENSKAGNKAFIVNRIGDVGFALGVMAVFATFGTLSFYTTQHTGFLDLATAGKVGVAAATLMGLLLFVGAVGKSAQFPLYVWLPDAMAGPTPVSALIHAATMVTAGVVMITRVSPLIVHSPVAMTVIACVGVFTAIFAASIALTQNDIKKVLAYSTVSQLGYMFLGCGVGAFASGMFHVTTHAFFKALLFLGAGSVIHALSGEQDMRKMGGLAKLIPITYWTMFAAWLAISGIPPFAGFWSKDEILGAASGYAQSGMVLYLVGLVTALMTAFYMTRLMAKTFWTAKRFNEAELAAHGHGGHGAAHDDPHAPDTGHAGEGVEEQTAHEAGHGVHESPPSMWIPLAVLAVLSTIGGLIGIPGHNVFEAFMEPSVGRYPVHEAIPVPLGMLLGTAAGAIGIAIAYALYSKRRETGDLMAPEEKQRHPLYRGSLNLWYVDWAFYRVFVGWGGAVATFAWQGIDRAVVDRTLVGLGYVTGFVSLVTSRAQTGYVRNYALVMLLGVVAVIAAFLLPALSR